MYIYALLDFLLIVR